MATVVLGVPLWLGQWSLRLIGTLAYFGFVVELKTFPENPNVAYKGLDEATIK